MVEGPVQKKARRPRYFTGATAIDTGRHFFVQWKDFDQCLELLTEMRKWLLITGPFQSGKSSLAYALADAAAQRGFISVVTTLTSDMVDSANLIASELEASDRFFGYLAHAVEVASGGALRRSSSRGHGGMLQVLELLQDVDRRGEPDVIWFIDEAGLLNDIRRPSIIRAFLGGLRTCREQSRSRSTYRLRSFSLVGTSRTERLLASANVHRVQAAGERRDHDPYNPFPLGLSISLSLETNRGEDFLEEEDILLMLQDYGREHGVSFRLGAQPNANENEVALHKLASHIYELTGGYKGLVGSCCEYIQGNNIRSLARWKWDVRNGSVLKYVLNFKVYSRIVSQIPTYSEQLKDFILACVSSPSSGLPYSDRERSLLLPAINDGVVAVDTGGNTVSISSAMLLSVILEDCKQAYTEPVPVVDTFEAAVRSSFRYMKPHRLSMAQVLNQNGQPSEYIWQSEFLLALKFVLENAYLKCKYTILVECKKRKKQGEVKVRVDFLLKDNGSSGSAVKAFEVQGKGNAQSIKQHIARSDKYRLLFTGCEMNYVYLVVGDDDEAKAVIQMESRKYDQVKCWFVQYLEQDEVWNVEQLQESGWLSVQLAVPSSYPQFKFATRES